MRNVWHCIENLLGDMDTPERRKTEEKHIPSPGTKWPSSGISDHGNSGIMYKLLSISITLTFTTDYMNNKILPRKRFD